MADGINLRAIVAEPLAAALGDGWTVIGHPDLPVRPSGHVVGVYTTDLKPLPSAPSSYEATLVVVVLTDSQDPRKADDDLDPALLEVLQVIWTIPDVVFESAQRVTRGDSHCWDITVRTAFTATPED